MGYFVGKKNIIEVPNNQKLETKPNGLDRFPNDNGVIGKLLGL